MIRPTEFEPMETRTAQPVFRLNGIPYYPHFKDPCWVQPGAFIETYNSIAEMMEFKEDKSQRLTSGELIRMGADLIEEYLWDRSWTKGWQKWLVQEFTVIKPWS